MVRQLLLHLNYFGLDTWQGVQTLGYIIYYSYQLAFLLGIKEWLHINTLIKTYTDQNQI